MTNRPSGASNPETRSVVMRRRLCRGEGMRQAERSDCPRQRLFFFFLSGLDDMDDFGSMLSSEKGTVLFRDFSDLEIKCRSENHAAVRTVCISLKRYALDAFGSPPNS